MEVIQEIGFRKSLKAAEPDGPYSSFFMYVGEVSAWKLKKLQLNWSKGQKSKEWCESVIAPAYKKDG